jgi:hypothetical protein
MRIFINESLLGGVGGPLEVENSKLVSWLVENVGDFIECRSWINIKGNGWRIRHYPTSESFDSPFYYKLAVNFDEPLNDYLVTEFYLRFV